MNKEIIENLKIINCLESEFYSEVICCFQDVDYEIIVNHKEDTGSEFNVYWSFFNVYENNTDSDIYKVLVEVYYIDDEKCYKVIEVNL